MIRSRLFFKMQVRLLLLRKATIRHSISSLHGLKFEALTHCFPLKPHRRVCCPATAHLPDGRGIAPLFCILFVLKKMLGTIWHLYYTRDDQITPVFEPWRSRYICFLWARQKFNYNARSSVPAHHPLLLAKPFPPATILAQRSPSLLVL